MDERSESDEWIDELVATWTEMYKKSMTTMVVLKLIAAAGQSSVEEIREMLDSATGWSFTERGLYRTMRRLTSLGLLSTAEIPVPRTGARRKYFELSEMGRRYLDRLELELLDR